MKNERIITDGSPQLLLEQYKLYVEMTDRVSARRVDTTKLYISLLTLLLAAITFVFGQAIAAEVKKIILLLVGSMGIILCIVWIINLNSYKQLNRLKFMVIHEIEPKLPFPCYKREWEILKKNPKIHAYYRLSKIEKFIPVVIMIPYLALIILTLFALF